MLEKIEAMLGLQDEINRRVHEDWRDQSFAWYRAVWLECAEMLEHYGWKWWKRQDPDLEQVKLELVDIWHFGLSMLLLEGRDARRIADELRDGEAAVGQGEEFPALLEDFVTEILGSRRFQPRRFAALMASAGLEFDALYRAYVGKNVLNFFRQDHGYRDGSYRKVWGGREDNEHLAELSRQLNSEHPDFQNHLYRALAQRYAESA